MIGRGIWIWLVLALGLGFGLFQLKYQVQGLESELARTNRQILESEEAIHVLKAEWSYLNRPERIETLARKYLDLQPLSGKQFGSFADLPGRSDFSAVTPEGGQSAPRAPLTPLPSRPPQGPQRGNVTLARDVR